MRTPEDAVGIRAYAEENACKKAVVVGGGFIGLEITENLMAKGIAVTVVDMAPQLMPNIFDPEMAEYAARHLRKKGLRVMTGTALKSVKGTDAVTGVETAAGVVPADLVVLSWVSVRQQVFLPIRVLRWREVASLQMNSRRRTLTIFMQRATVRW